MEGRDLVYSNWGYVSSYPRQWGGSRGSTRTAPVAVWSPWSALCGCVVTVVCTVWLCGHHGLHCVAVWSPWSALCGCVVTMVCTVWPATNGYIVVKDFLVLLIPCWSHFWASEMCTVHRNRTLFQPIHQKCVPCTETEHFPDSIHKAVFTDYKTNFKNETHWYTIIQKYQHTHLTQIKSHAEATRWWYKLMYGFQFLLDPYVGIANGGGHNASNE